VVLHFISLLYKKRRYSTKQVCYSITVEYAQSYKNKKGACIMEILEMAVLSAPPSEKECFDRAYDKFISSTDTDELIKRIVFGQYAQEKNADELFEATPVETLEQFLYTTAKHFYNCALLEQRSTVLESAQLTSVI
jgi:hypothetical protein